MPIILTCLHCKYYIKDLECKAFDSIPFEILSGKLEHNKIFENQVGNFVFEKVAKGIKVTKGNVYKQI